MIYNYSDGVRFLIVLLEKILLIELIHGLFGESFIIPEFFGYTVQVVCAHSAGGYIVDSNYFNFPQ